MSNEDYRHDSGEFVGHDNEYDNDNQDDPIEADTKQFYFRRARKEPVIEDCRHRILYPLRLRLLFPNDARTLRPKASLEPNQILN